MNVDDPAISGFLEGKEGVMSVYSVPPLERQYSAALRDGSRQSVTGVVGGERGEILEKNAKLFLEFHLAREGPSHTQRHSAPP